MLLSARTADIYDLTPPDLGIKVVNTCLKLSAWWTFLLTDDEDITVLPNMESGVGWWYFTINEF